jgi:hypothetical protein
MPMWANVSGAMVPCFVEYATLEDVLTDVYNWTRQWDEYWESDEDDPEMPVGIPETPVALIGESVSYSTDEINIRILTNSRAALDNMRLNVWSAVSGNVNETHYFTV